MAKERAFMARNTGTKEAPVWEIWFPKVTADAVMMSDNDGETKTITDFVLEKINDLIGGAPATYDTLKEIADYIAAHEEVADALNAAIADKASKDVATTNADGLMSKEDKVKLNGIAAGANKYVHPEYTAAESGLYKLTVDAQGHVTAATEVTKEDIIALGIPGSNTTYSKATQTADGLMSKEDKKKLDETPTINFGTAYPENAPTGSIFGLIAE